MTKYYSATTDNAENYDEIGEFETIEQAAVAFFSKCCDNTVWIAEGRPPTSPEEYIYANDLLEIVQMQDDYSFDAAEDFGILSEQHHKALTETIRSAFRGFLEIHDLMPTHSVCKNPMRFERKTP